MVVKYLILGVTNMKIGIPKEIKKHEYRVSVTPDGAEALVEAGHKVFVQSGAGEGVGFSNLDYKNAGCVILEDSSLIFQQSQLIVKVKEPQPKECKMLSKNHILFTYLHLAADPKQAELLMKSGATCIAYETITSDEGGLPLLSPMSEIAGRMSIQAGAHHLEKTQGGSGVLLSGANGVDAAEVLVIGGGVVGINAAEVALGMGARVVILDLVISERLEKFGVAYDGQLKVEKSTEARLKKYLGKADLVVGAVLVAGASAPKVITREMLGDMKPGSVLVDVAIDQGGCFETSEVTTHDKPTYVVDGIIHYCVGNMPGAVAQTGTKALTRVTLPYIMDIANKGVVESLEGDKNLQNGLNIYRGGIVHEAVRDSLS